MRKTSDKTNSKMLRGVICTLAGGICWGFSGTCGQYLFDVKGIDSHWLSVVRMLSAGILLTLFAIPKHRKELAGIWRSGRDLGHMILFGIFGLMICQFTYLTAISHSNAGTATVLQNLGPVLIMLVVCVRKRKLPARAEVLAIILAVAGVFVIATHGDIHSLSISPKGLMWGLLAAVGMMLYTLLSGGIVERWGSPVVTGYGMIIGGILLAVLVRVWQYEIVLDLETVLALAAIVVIGTACAFTLFLQGVSDIGPIRGSMLGCVEPVAATVFSVIWLGTSFGWMDLLGFVLIMSTVVLLTLSQKKAAAQNVRREGSGDNEKV